MLSHHALAEDPATGLQSQFIQAARGEGPARGTVAGQQTLCPHDSSACPLLQALPSERVRKGHSCPRLRNDDSLCSSDPRIFSSLQHKSMHPFTVSEALSFSLLGIYSSHIYAYQTLFS